MSDLNQIRDLFKRANVEIDRNDVWEVQSAKVVKHKALERLAAALRITFDPPQILRAERDEAVILATGRIEGQCIEWSIGEACVNVNYRISGKMAAYVYAMAEKRAKDRVILKLAGLHGVYSEDEADEFKHGEKAEEAPAPAPAPAPAGETKAMRNYAHDFLAWLAKTTDLQLVRNAWKTEQESRLSLGIRGTALEAELRAAWEARGIALAKKTEPANVLEAG